MQLIHMNGRGYDYNLGRFLSVDPIIQAPGNSQSMNPYSYIMNNPLAGTDPTGYTATGEKSEPPVKVLQKEVKIKHAPTTGSRLGRTETVTVTATANGSGGHTVSLSGGSEAARATVAGMVGAAAQAATSNIGSQGQRSNTQREGSSELSSEMQTAFQGAEDNHPLTGSPVAQASFDEEVVVTGNRPQLAALPLLLGVPLEIWLFGGGAVAMSQTDAGKDATNALITRARDAFAGGATASPGGGGFDPEDPNNEKFKNTNPWDYKEGVARHELINKNGIYYVSRGGNLTRAKGNYDFVTINGRTYVGKPHAGHANIARGRPVHYAGQLHFGRGTTTRGVLKSWNNQSGHYLPTAARANQAGFSLQRFTTDVLF